MFFAFSIFLFQTLVGGVYNIFILHGKGGVRVQTKTNCHDKGLREEGSRFPLICITSLLNSPLLVTYNMERLLQICTFVRPCIDFDVKAGMAEMKLCKEMNGRQHERKTVIVEQKGFMKQRGTSYATEFTLTAHL